MASRNSLRHRLRNHFREHSLTYQLAAILGGTLAVGALFIFLVKLFQSGQEARFVPTEGGDLTAFEIKPQEQVFPQPVGLESFSLRQVIDYALEAHGGRKEIESIISMRRKGMIKFYGSDSGVQNVPSSILFRRPHYIRYNYSFEGSDYVAAFDGTHAWRELTQNSQVHPFRRMGTQESLLMKIDIQTILPLSETLGTAERLSLVTELSDPDRPTWPILHDLGWMTETLHFDRTHFLCVRRMINAPLPDRANPLEVKIEYEDYRYVGRVAMPFKLRVWIDGELNNEIAIETTEINIGVLPMVFQQPSK